MGYIKSISGSIVKVKLNTEKIFLFELSYVGNRGLIGEVIEVDRDEAVIQVYEDTEGLKLKEPVIFTGKMLEAILGPGLLGNIYDGIQRPLELLGERVEKGEKRFPLDKEKQWHFIPQVKKGDHIKKGSVIGVVEEKGLKHKVLSEVEGEVLYVAPEGDYTIEEEVLRTKDRKIKLYTTHPVRIPIPFKNRLTPSIPLITGQRVIDFLFPIAKGGTASLPGGFGTGKTILQQTLAKWSDADVVVYIGCGERGNEMTEVLEEFPQLEDPRTGKKLIDRTVLIANTSDMPVSAREASIYLGITIAEYFRNMGYHVALMADSTSRWAEAMREISARLNQLPVEEGFPADLSSKIASVYERAGYVETFSGEKGSLTIIGAVSPPGGDFSEPVTRHTRRFTSVFWALDRELASARFYPAVNYILSYSSYVETVKDWWSELDPHWSSLRQWIIQILQEDDRLQRIVKLLGIQALPEDQKLIVEIANLIKELFLQQNAFDPVDAYSSPKKQLMMAHLIKTVYQEWEKAFKEKSVPVSVLKNQPIIDQIVKSKYQISDENIQQFNTLIEKIVETYRKITAEYGD